MFMDELACMLNVSPSQDLITDRIRQLQGVSKDGQNVREKRHIILKKQRLILQIKTLNSEY